MSATLLAAALLTLAAAPAAAQVTPQPADTFDPATRTATSDATSEAAPPAMLAVNIDNKEAAIGDRLNASLILTLMVPAGGPPRFPVWERHWGDAEILTVEEPVDQGDGVWTQQLELTVFEVGLATLPAVEIELPASGTTTTIASAPVVVAIRSVLPPGEQQAEPQAPEPVRSLPAGERFWWTVALLGLAGCALTGLALRTAQLIKKTLAALALSPIDALSKALGGLRREHDTERLFTGLSLELRRYLGRSIGFPAAEGTTTQIQRQLRAQQLPPELIRETLGLLREVDQIKFARGDADPQRAGQRLDDTAALARNVEAWLTPAEPAPVEPGAPAEIQA